jgi:hypothetical protein
MKIRRYVPDSQRTFAQRIRQAAAEKAEALRDPELFRAATPARHPVVRLRVRGRR